MNTTHNKRQLSSGISIIAIAAALGMATPAEAQSELSNLQGHVTGVAPGTQVVAVDQQTGQRAVGKVDANGDYVILGVRPSTYTVSVAGRAPQTTTVLVGQTVTVDFAEAQAPAGGTITVTGRRTRQPVLAQTVATNITPAQIENLPQNQRNFLSFADLAPGVQVAPGGTAQIQAGAIASNNVNVLLDGMSFKNPINHGGVFGQNFGLGNPFPQIAIQEYQVQTQNFGAETGQAGSALLTAITKTGGNKFFGSAFIEWQPKAFISKPFCTKGNGPFDPVTHCAKQDYDRKQFGGELGGPIIPDRVSFYIAGEGTIETLPGSIGSLPTTPGGAPIFPPNVVSQIVGTPRNFDFRQGLYFGKLTFTPSDTETVNLMAYVRRENNLSDVDANATPSHGRTILTHQSRLQLQWKHSSGDFLNQFNMAYDKATQSTPTVTSGNQYVLTNTPCVTSAGVPDPSCSNFAFVTINPETGALNPLGNGIVDFGINGGFAYLGAHFFTQGDNQKGFFLRDDATLRRGQHTIKFGGQLNFLTLDRTVINFTNPSFFYFNPGPTGNFDQLTQQPEAALIATGANPSLHANDTQIGVYVQDEWKPDDHWTVNAGIRWDFEDNANNNQYITPPAIAAALRAYPGWKARGIDPEDYISNGHNRPSYYGEFQPRLGVSYDVHGDRDLVIFGGAGRYYDRSLFIEGAIEKITNANYITQVTFCPPGTTPPAGGNGSSVANCAAFDPAFLTNPELLRAIATSQGVGGSVWVLPNKIHPPFSDQFDLGVRKRFGDIIASVTFSHINSHHLFMFTRANFFENGWYTRFVTRDANGNVTGCTNGGDAWIQDQIPGGLTNADGTPVPTSICAAQNGQLAGFPGKLNRGQDNGKAKYNAIYLTIEKPFTDTSRWGVQSSFTYQRARTNVEQELNSDEFYNGTDFGVYGTTGVNGVPKWRWVTAGTYRAPFDVILSGILTLSRGPAFGNIAAPWNGGPAAPDGACCYGNLGGVFYPKEKIGYKRLDMRVAKTFKMPWGHELTADFQVFNVFNWLNRNYTSWDAGGGAPAPRTDNLAISNDQREFQAGLKYKF
ncbi:MAG: TonB-dependent receptor domain-containing protein [Bacillota bacterium]